MTSIDYAASTIGQAFPPLALAAVGLPVTLATVAGIVYALFRKDLQAEAERLRRRRERLLSLRDRPVRVEATVHLRRIELARQERDRAAQQLEAARSREPLVAALEGRTRRAIGTGQRAA